jgi:hypothetical protein
LFALVVGPLVLLEPYFRLDRDFPFAAVEGLPGAALGAGNDHLAHMCSLLWLIMNAKSLSKDLTRIRRDHAGLHQTPPGVGVLAALVMNTAGSLPLPRRRL